METSKKYRKKPVEIEAIKWDGTNIGEVLDFFKTLSRYTIREIGTDDIEGDMFSFRGNELYIKTLEGEMKANVGDFIIRGIKGEFYPCKPDIFEATYDCLELVDTVTDEIIDNVSKRNQFDKFIHINISSDEKIRQFMSEGLTYPEMVGLLRIYEAHITQKGVEELDI